MENKIIKIRKFAENILSNNKCSAHNMEHVDRVLKMAINLAKGERVDLEIIKIAVLLHDIGGDKEMSDPSGMTDHATESAKMAEPFLKELKFSQTKIQHILDCILSHRYRTDSKPKTKEAEIVFDADKLETVGAIGIARALAWVGKNNAHIYKKVNIKKYAKENLGGKINGRIQDKTKHSPQINWETKDKFIVDYLHTTKAKKIARQRVKFSENFLGRLEREVLGKE